GAGGNAARRCLKKIWPLRFVAFGYPSPPGWCAPLDKFVGRAVTREHHLRRTGHNRAEAARLDARLLKCHAHGLHLSRDCQCEHSWRDGGYGFDVRPWPSIALLFAIAGELRRRTGTLVLDDLGG